MAESVRIERSGTQILNSRSEYSRCWVPRLRIILEDWKAGSREDGPKSPKTINARGSNQEDCVNTQTGSETNNVQETLMSDAEFDEIARLESESRRKEGKRKNPDQNQRRSKKRKLPRLEGWGEMDDRIEENIMEAWRDHI